MNANVADTARRLARSLQFSTDWRALFVNSSYHLRNGLYNEIKKNAKNISGDVLDFGCGSKPYEKLFSKSTKYIGVDILTSGHDHRNSKVDVYYDGISLPFPDNAFDNIICFEVFEHLPNVEVILVEFIRILKPKGRIYLTIPFMYPEHEMPYDFQRWTRSGIRNILSANNFDVIQIVKTNTEIQALGQNIVEYIFGNLFPNKLKYSHIIKLPFVAFFNTLILFANALLPEGDNYFSNIFIEAVNVK